MANQLMFRALASFVFLYGLIPCDAFGEVQEGQPVDFESLIEAAASRSESLYSGVVTFGLKVGRSEIGGQVHHTPPSDFTLSFRGSEWALRMPGHANVEVYRDGFQATYTARTKLDDAGGRLYSLRLTNGMPLDRTPGVWSLAARLGTFFYGEIGRYIAANRDAVIDRGVRELDGTQCRVLAWEVVPNDYDEAFIHIPGPIMQNKGGFLVVYLAPELAGAVTRYEYETNPGDVYYRVSASGFDELSAGIHFPMLVTLETMWHDGSVKMVNEYAVHTAEQFNETVSDSHFDIEFPVGTRIRDSRPGRPMALYTASTSAALDDVEHHIAASLPAVESKRTHVSALVVFNCIAFVLVLAAFFVRRRLSRS